MLSISLYTIWGGMQVIEGDLDLPLYVLWMDLFLLGAGPGQSVFPEEGPITVDGLPNCEMHWFKFLK